MKKTVSVIFVLLLVTTSCVTLPRKTHINWPEKISYLEALCELDMSWRDMKYSGSMSVKMRYPDQFTVEVYGPFGETVMYIQKDKGRFLFVSSDERYNDQKRFEERFGIKLDEFIDDMALRNYVQNSPEGHYYKREKYVVIYRLDNNEDRICWKGKDGSICVSFLEAVFDEERHVGKDSGGKM